jgi:hypothetical protein
MKKPLLLLFFCQAFFLQAQNKIKLQDRVSVRLTMTNVFGISRYSSFGINYKPINNSGYYEFKKWAFDPPSHFSPLDIGMLLSWKMKNEWRCIFGISQDGATCRYSISFREMYVFGKDTSYGERHIEGGGGVANTKFPLLFSKTIFNTDSLRTAKKHNYGAKIDMLFGVNYIYQPGPNRNVVLIDDGYDSILVSPSKYLSYSSKLYASGGWGAAWNIGFNCDVKYKRRQLFSLSVYYKQGIEWGNPFGLLGSIFRRLNISPSTSWMYNKIDVTVDGKKYTHDIYSRGSGIYVQLSKDFSFAKKKNKLIESNRIK